MLEGLHRLTRSVNEYKDDFAQAVVGRSMKAAKRDPTAAGGDPLSLYRRVYRPKRKDIPEAAILMQTREGVAVRYSPEQTAS